MWWWPCGGVVTRRVWVGRVAATLMFAGWCRQVGLPQDVAPHLDRPCLVGVGIDQSGIFPATAVSRRVTCVGCRGRRPRSGRPARGWVGHVLGSGGVVGDHFRPQEPGEFTGDGGDGHGADVFTRR